MLNPVENGMQMLRTCRNVVLAGGCISVALLIIATMIVVSLIPIYLPNSASSVSTDTSPITMLDLTLSSSYQIPSGVDSSYRTVSNIDELHAPINTALGLPQKTVRVQSSKFLPSATRVFQYRRRRQVLCDVSENQLAGDFLSMNLVATYPSYCSNNAPCKVNFRVDLVRRFNSLNSLQFTVALGNGTVRVTLSVRVCHITAEVSGTTTTTTTTTTVTSTTTGATAISPSSIFYSFDGNAKNLYNLFNGIEENGATYVPTGITGYGSALSLQSSLLQYVLVPSPPSLQLAQTSFTFEMWVNLKTASTSVDQGLIGQCSSESVNGVCFYLSITQGRPYMGFTPSTDCLGARVLSASQWYHLAFVYSLENKQCSIYINGTLDVTCSSTQLYQGSTSELTIGKVLLANPFYFDGQIDQLLFTNRAKQSNEILIDGTLAAQYTFNDNSLLDSGPNGINGTSVGTTFSAGALSFTTNSYFEASGFVILGTKNFPYSLSLWINPSMTTSGTLIHLYVTGSSFCLPALGFTAAGHLYAQQWSTTGAVGVTYYTAIPLTTWTHIVYTYSEVIQLYVNGILGASSLPLRYQPPGSPMTLAFGNCGSAPSACGCNQGPIVAGQYQGLIDKIEIYSRALSADDVKTLAAAGH